MHCSSFSDTFFFRVVNEFNGTLPSKFGAIQILKKQNTRYLLRFYGLVLWETKT